MNKDVIVEESSLSIKTRKTIRFIVLVLITIMCLFWFYILFITATRNNSQITLGISFLPGKSLITNFNNMVKDNSIPVINGFFNSMFIAACTAVVTTYFSTMTAYAIHAYNFKFKNAIFTFILMIMMIPNQVTSLGYIQMLRDLGWMNNFAPLILPTIAAPVTFFYLKQYMESCLPHSLLEAARIDGSGEFRTFNSIVFPLMKPAIAVQAIFAFVNSWNNFFQPNLILTDLRKKTLPVLIAMLRSKDWSTLDRGQTYMTMAVSILPVVVVYCFLARFIVQGLTVGSVKE